MTRFAMTNSGIRFATRSASRQSLNSAANSLGIHDVRCLRWDEVQVLLAAPALPGAPARELAQALREGRVCLSATVASKLLGKAKSAIGQSDFDRVADSLAQALDARAR